jgi:hypothetical protein
MENIHTLFEKYKTVVKPLTDFKIGDRVKFKDYMGTSKYRGKAKCLSSSGWLDWQNHINQECTIIKKSVDPCFDWLVEWDDKQPSLTDENNLILILRKI